jgi:glycosyltransferase involved in cell wall biosynthesis
MLPCPKVSVVITCYNYGLYVSEAIESVLDQTFKDFEVIVIDDGSTDDTLLVMEQYRSYQEIRYIRQENQGQPKAKNRGIAESKGEFVAFLDADDIWLPEKLELQLQLFINPSVGVGYTRRYWIDPSGKVIKGNERTLRRGNILNYIFIDNFVCFSSSMVRRGLLTTAGGFDETIPMGIDYDLWVRLASRCQFDYVDRPLVKYRTGHANLSRNTVKRYECAEKIMRKNLADSQVRKEMSWWVPRLAWADTWKNKGNAARSLGNYLDAALLYVRALTNYPLFAGAWIGLARCLIRKN